MPFETFPYTNFHDLNLDWILDRLRKLQAEWEEFKNHYGPMIDEHEREITELQERLNQLIIDLESGKYAEQYLKYVQTWIDQNMAAIIGNVVKYVTFGLTNDGYFCAFIPTTWQFITFNTIITDTNDPLYGHLTITW